MPLSWHETMVALNGGHQTYSRNTFRGLGKGQHAALAQGWQQILSEYERLKPSAQQSISRLSTAKRDLDALVTQARAAASGAGEDAADYASRIAGYAVRASSDLAQASSMLAAAMAEVERVKQEAASGTYRGPTLSMEFLTPIRTVQEAAGAAASQVENQVSEAQNLVRQIRNMALEEQNRRQRESDRIAEEKARRADEIRDQAARDAQARADAQALRDLEEERRRAQADRDAQLRADEAARRQSEIEASRYQIEVSSQQSQAQAQASIQQAQIAADLERARMEAAERRETQMLELELMRLEKEEERLMRQEEREAQERAFDRTLKLVAAGLIPPQAVAQAVSPQMAVAPGMGPSAYTFQQPGGPPPVVGPYGPGIEFAPAFDPGTQMFGMRGVGAMGQGSGWCAVANPNLPRGAQVLCGYKISGPAADPVTGASTFQVVRSDGSTFFMGAAVAQAANQAVNDRKSGTVFYRTPDTPITAKDVLDTTSGAVDVLGKAAGFGVDLWRRVAGKGPAEPEPELRQERGGSVLPMVLTVAAVGGVGLLVLRGMAKKKPAAAPAAATNPRRRRRRKGRR